MLITNVYTMLGCRGLRTLANLKSIHKRSAAAAGVGRQLAAYGDGDSEMHQSPEGFGDFESDFLDLHKSYKCYEDEQQWQKTKIRQYMVKSKYFKETKLPNFLTYAEKEQIRYLHNRDPEQWSVEVLADSFPATCGIINKIIKANWKPLSAKRIISHNIGVSKNWDMFREGKLDLDLPKELKNHLEKFVPRQKVLPQSCVNSEKQNSMPIPQEGTWNENKSSKQELHPNTNIKAENFKFKRNGMDMKRNIYPKFTDSSK